MPICIRPPQKWLSLSQHPRVGLPNNVYPTLLTPQDSYSANLDA
jgi:hypothetical protein